MRYVVMVGDQIFPARTRAQAYAQAKQFSLYSNKKVVVKDLTKVPAGSKVWS